MNCGHRKLNWLDWYFVWLESSLDTISFVCNFCFVFRVAVQTTALSVCAPFYEKTVVTIAKKVHIYLWAIALYYFTSRLWQWRKVNHKPIITFYNCKICWYLKLCTKTHYDLTVGPSLFNNMSFTLKTLFGFFIRCPHGNVHLMSVSVPGGEVGALIFSYIRRLGPFFGFNILNFNIPLVFRKMNIFWGYE